MLLVVGLGNPIPEYGNTRHNAGAIFVERLLNKVVDGPTAGFAFHKHQEKFEALLDEVNGDVLQREKIFLLRPQTYMNSSGRSVAACLNFFKMTNKNLLVAHDELELPFGEIKIKNGGGHGGHNGVRSIHQSLNTNEYTRVRIGIGRPPEGIAVRDYVLGKFDKQERELLNQKIDSMLDNF
ncbi:MAG: aminoacyl-tRNA hydrolase [Holosporales bacterium]|jgi:PTH1 family peptidyl-tRNA hydrolase|nr:aminoacyl-tRNA hydrolase [Holosporales bacterium]